MTSSVLITVLRRMLAYNYSHSILKPTRTRFLLLPASDSSVRETEIKNYAEKKKDNLLLFQLWCAICM